MKNNRLLGLVVATGILSISSAASAYNVVFGNRDTENVRTEFTNSLNTNSLSTVIDDGTNFGIAPSAGTAFPSVTRSGTINGDSFSYTIYDVDFSDSPNDTITPGSDNPANDIDELDNINIEIPAKQDDAEGIYGWGVDGRTGSGTSGAALFDFTGNPIGHFGIDLHDFEAGFGVSPSNTTSGASGEIRLYKSGILAFSYTLQFPGPDGGGGTDNPSNGTANDSSIAGFGNRQSMFVGITADNTSEFFDQIAFVLGDDDVDTVGIPSNINDGSTEQWAADGFTFGEAFQDSAAVPFEFSPTLGLFVMGGLWIGKRKIKK